MSQPAIVFDRDLEVIRRHMITAQIVKNRLSSVAKGDPLTAQEVLDGVRLTHEEYLDLVERAVRAYKLERT